MTLDIKCPRCRGDLDKTEVEAGNVVIIMLKCTRCKWRLRIKIKKTEKFDWVSEIAKMRIAEERKKGKHI